MVMIENQQLRFRMIIPQTSFSYCVISFSNMERLIKRHNSKSAKKVWDYIRPVGEGDPLGIMQEVEIWRKEQMVYAQPEH